MPTTLSNDVRRLGVASATAYVILSVLYAVTLTIGFLSLSSQDEPIGEPMFTILEVLILFLMTAAVTLMSVIHAWASPQRKTYAVLSLAFTSILAALTCSVHFVILTVSREPAFANLPSAPLLLSFRWPSVAYALDILAWDVFFPLAALSAAVVFDRDGLAGRIRTLLVLSAAVSFLGLAGVFTGDMMVRNIGIIGYALIFPVAAALIGALFSRLGR